MLMLMLMPRMPPNHSSPAGRNRGAVTPGSYGCWRQTPGRVVKLLRQVSASLFSAVSAGAGAGIACRSDAVLPLTGIGSCLRRNDVSI